MLLDEPLDALDVSLRAQVRAEVRAVLLQSGATGLLVTHDQQEALSLADDVAVMRGGAIVQAAAPRSSTATRSTPSSRFLGEAVLLRRALARRARGDGTRTPADPRSRRRRARGNSDAAPGADPLREPGAGAQAGACSRSSSTVTTRPRGSPSMTRPRPRSPRARSGHSCPQVGEQVSLVVEGTALALPGREA